MIKLLIFLFTFLFAIPVMVSAQAIFNVREETAYPYDEHTEQSKQQDTWYINGTGIKYKTGSYPVKVNAEGVFDTIRLRKIYIQQTVSMYDWPFDKKKKKYLPPPSKIISDTANIIILCKLREQHNYKLGQIFPGHFEMYSLDTFETRKSIVFKVKNKKQGDTLHLYVGYKEYKIHSDTIIQIIIRNDNMEESSLEYVSLFDKTREAASYGKGMYSEPLLNLYYQFLHAENLEIEYDAESKKYQLKLLN